MRLVANIKNSVFVKSVGILVLGTSGGQLILVASTPVLTRIYSPDNFGILALYTAALSVLSIAVGGRYEQAVMLPKKDADSKSLVYLSFAITCFLTCMVAVVLGVSSMRGDGSDGIWPLFLIPALFLTGIFQVFSVWNNRKQDYKKIATANITQTASTSVSQIVLGLYGAQQYGLLLGSLMGVALGVFVFVKAMLAKLFSLYEEIEPRLMLENAKKYKEFPVYSLFGAFVNNLALQSPVFFIGAMFSSAYTGQYGLASRVVFVPIVLVSTAVFQVMFKQISNLAHGKKAALRSYLFGRFALLFFLGAPFFVLFNIWSLEIFTYIFGSQWAEAGEFAKYLAWVAFIKFSITPLTAVFLLKGRVKFGTYWQLGYFVTLTSTMTALHHIGSTIEIFLRVFLVHELILNLICLGLVWIVSSSDDGDDGNRGQYEA